MSWSDRTFGQGAEFMLGEIAERTRHIQHHVETINHRLETGDQRLDWLTAQSVRQGEEIKYLRKALPQSEASSISSKKSFVASLITFLTAARALISEIAGAKGWIGWIVLMGLAVSGNLKAEEIRLWAMCLAGICPG
jgi:hypothetical protein